jgi:hypothetical protein
LTTTGSPWSNIAATVALFPMSARRRRRDPEVGRIEEL